MCNSRGRAKPLPLPRHPDRVLAVGDQSKPWMRYPEIGTRFEDLLIPRSSRTCQRRSWPLTRRTSSPSEPGRRSVREECNGRRLLERLRGGCRPRADTSLLPLSNLVGSPSCPTSVARGLSVRPRETRACHTRASATKASRIGLSSHSRPSTRKSPDGMLGVLRDRRYCCRKVIAFSLLLQGAGSCCSRCWISFSSGKAVW